MNRKLKVGLCMSFVYLVLAFMYLPILALIIYSFTTARVIGVWDGFSLDLYFRVFVDSEMMEAVTNTLVVALVSSTLATLIGTVSAVGIFYLKKIKKTVASTINQITVINADIVTGVAFMLFFITFQFSDGYATLIIAHTIITIPYVVLSVLPRLSQLNPNTYEAGLDLGASPIKTLFTVVIPQLIPSMIAGFAMAFTLSLDDFVITKFNNGNEIDTISTYLYNSLAKSTIPEEMRAFSSMLFIVSLLILIMVNIYSRKKTKKNSLLNFK